MAGPAGLTAALELLETTDVLPLVFEADGMVGGLAKTDHLAKGNRMDIGGHRFFLEELAGDELVGARSCRSRRRSRRGGGNGWVGSLAGDGFRTPTRSTA